MGGFSGTANLITELARQTAKLSHTGNTDETVLLTVTVPALGINSYMDLCSLWSYTNNGNTKTLRIRIGGIGGTALMQLAATTTASLTDIGRKILNRGATNSQVSNVLNAFGSISSGAAATSAIETNAGTTLVFTVQLASAADTASLEYATVNLFM